MSATSTTIVIEAFCDDQVRVWVASARDWIGLATEAATIEDLRQRLAVMVPDLLDDGHCGPFGIEPVASNRHLA